MKRPPHKGRHPVHVTLRARHGLPSFRQQVIQAVLAGVIRDQRHRKYQATFRLLHYSIQRSHLHVIVEADTEAAKDYLPLRSGVSGLAIAFARRLNKLLGRRGKVWSDRYDRHDLKTPTEARRGLEYVFNNYTKHGVKTFGAGVLDPFSSACIFDGWAGPHFVPAPGDLWLWPVCRARTWLARIGWAKRNGKMTIEPTGLSPSPTASSTAAPQR